MATDSMPKIPLDSRADLNFVRANVHGAIRDKLEKHLPSTAAGSSTDALRKRVEELLEEFVARTFEYAQPSLLVNGLDATSQPTDEKALEPYDPSLHTRVQNLHAELEEATLQVTRLRRESPRLAANAYRQSLETWTREALSQVAAEEETREQGEAIKVDPLQRREDAARDYEQAMSTLQTLNKSIPATNAKLERVQNVIHYLHTGE